MSSPDSTRIQATLREALETQIREADPPETKATFDRLRAAGVPEDGVWRLLSVALLAELNAMSKDGRPYDRDSYVSRLSQLPKFKVD